MEESKEDVINDSPIKDTFKFNDHFWFHDVGPDPSARKGESDWKLYDDHKSVMLERRYHAWIQAGKNRELD